MQRGVIENLIYHGLGGMVDRWPWLVWVYPVTLIVVLVLLAALVLILLERKVSAHMQGRLGPMHHGFHGLAQTIWDALKLIQKEDIIAAHADKLVMIIAPFIVFIPAVVIYAVMPFGQGWIIQDLNIGIFFLFAVSSLATVGIVTAGWAGNNKWSLLGGLRSAAQVISYEIPLVVAFITVVLMAGTFSMREIVERQEGLPFALWFPGGTLAFLIYVIAALAETNRAPFDLPEAESELVAGFHTEYSGFRFAIFFLAEFANLMAVSMIATTIFLGGWLAPWFWPASAGAFWFFFKTAVMIFVFMWIRWTLPRLRIDQMLNTAWKGLIPISLVNLVVVALLMAIYY